MFVVLISDDWWVYSRYGFIRSTKPHSIDVSSLVFPFVSIATAASTSTLTVPLQSLTPFKFLLFSKLVNSNVYLYPINWFVVVPIVSVNFSTFVISLVMLSAASSSTNTCNFDKLLFASVVVVPNVEVFKYLSTISNTIVSFLLVL